MTDTVSLSICNQFVQSVDNPHRLTYAMRVILPITEKVATHYGATLEGLRREIAGGWPVLGFAAYTFDDQLVGAVGDFPAQAQLSFAI